MTASAAIPIECLISHLDAARKTGGGGGLIAATLHAILAPRRQIASAAPPQDGGHTGGPAAYRGSSLNGPAARPESPPVLTSAFATPDSHR
jgi:hypothetical protein